jgi:hypothetical protein
MYWAIYTYLLSYFDSKGIGNIQHIGYTKEL